jgi:uncharacterized protein (DUF488 family)
VAAPILYTTGYEQHATAHDLIASLRTVGIDRLVDVRELPLSRRRGFSKTALAGALADDGIAYEHVRALGNPYRELYRSGRRASGAARYRKRLRNGSRQAVTGLATSLKATTTCILCVEAAHETCHRIELAAALEAELPRLRVVHLT